MAMVTLHSRPYDCKMAQAQHASCRDFHKGYFQEPLGTKTGTKVVYNSDRRTGPANTGVDKVSISGAPDISSGVLSGLPPSGPLPF